jgi:penicillin-binding protein 1C
VNNGALVIVGNTTRDVLAYIGSDNFDDSLAQGQVDAIRALRSPGSTLKPFLVAMEIDNGTLTPKTRLLDTPYDAEGFYAENYSGTYSGLVYADDALRRSLNVPMIRLLKQRGVTPFLDRLHLAGFPSLDAQRSRLGLSVILGGCGVRLDELVAAFASFPNGGLYRPLRFVTADERKPDTRVFSPSAAYMVTDILAGIDRPDLPNNFESAINLAKVAFKTGTSYGRRDAWAIGYSSEFTIGVWMGNVNHRGSPELTGGKAAAPLLIDLFTSISKKRQKTVLPIPGDVQTRDVCATSGLAPTPRCTHLIEDYYSIRKTVNRYCTIDREFLVSPDGATQYCPACLGRHPYKARTFADYPAELVSFWRSSGQSFTHIPSHNPACTQTFAGEGPKIVSPSQDMTYFIVSSAQKITLRASSPADIAEHIWYVDNRYLAREKASDRLFISMSDGEHTVTCMDDRGRLSTVRIRVKHVL